MGVRPSGRSSYPWSLWKVHFRVAFTAACLVSNWAHTWSLPYFLCFFATVAAQKAKVQNECGTMLKLQDDKFRAYYHVLCDLRHHLWNLPDVTVAMSKPIRCCYSVLELIVHGYHHSMTKWRHTLSKSQGYHGMTQCCHALSKSQSKAIMVWLSDAMLFQRVKAIIVWLSDATFTRSR